MIIFITRVSQVYLIWAEQQRSNARNKDTKLELDVLIIDITDETCNKKKSKSDKGLALYGNKPENDKKGKGKGKSNSKCKYYSYPSPKYKQKNCFGANLEKQKK
jgi:hypothetical protein